MRRVLLGDFTLGAKTAGGGEVPSNKPHSEGESLGETDNCEVGEDVGDKGLSCFFRTSGVEGMESVNNGPQAFPEELITSLSLS